MIRRWFGKCEAWDPAYEAVQCKLRYGHDGGHHFGGLHTGYLRLNLDGPPVKAVARMPTEPATPPKGPAGVSTTHCECRSPRREPPVDQSWLEVDKGGV